ncbi:hypothetical protein PFICI_08436 [Pestalotiopsis fici W106-1]|uniref:FAD-binding domain-containing protein n=1 Tax=Pestalotiopsis fici (strain W106-1 / CGMCC3.15140) TaxID=1229662 RepID=W3X696_PESFW|nr:uncharacterized protein PFICI_08436 [Pestalotiopsis fici W106-1]ETS80907.1 hypothetical protein PFICI_08436 [Pestalotiopsis fici W106-1]
MNASSMQRPPIIIIGAGVAGLTLAQGLRLRSIPFRLFERHPKSHSSQGHRFRVSKEGQEALSTVLSSELKNIFASTAPGVPRIEPRYVDTRNLDFSRPKPVDPVSIPMDRTWFRMLFTLDIEDAIEYGKEFKSFTTIDQHIQVHIKDGSHVIGRLLVGADGIKSHVRRQLQPERKFLDLDRWVLWGRTPMTESLKEYLSQDLLSWCMYLDNDANVQAIVEPMYWPISLAHKSQLRLPEFQDYLYWVICTAKGQFSAELPKTTEEKQRYLMDATKAWHPTLKALFSSASHERSACVWVLSSIPDIEICSGIGTKSVVLIGDAAHPMSPMGGSGADTAIRTAADLAETIAEQGITPEKIVDFERRMAILAKEKIEHSFSGGKKFWKGTEWNEYREMNI